METRQKQAITVNGMMRLATLPYIPARDLPAGVGQVEETALVHFYFLYVVL
jgi:hypothetical protein